MPSNASSAVQDRSHGPAHLPPGSELDARVARALGWRRNATGERPWQWLTPEGFNRALPAYSRNPKDAMRLLAMLLQRDLSGTITFHAFRYSHGLTVMVARFRRHSATGEDLEHAISLLALELLEKEATT